MKRLVLSLLLTVLACAATAALVLAKGGHSIRLPFGADQEHKRAHRGQTPTLFWRT